MDHPSQPLTEIEEHRVMVVKCPSCGTSYKLPDTIIKDKPKKLRCKKCNHTFTIARKESLIPKGYTEFTGGHQLPSEFSFLEKEAAPPPPPPQEAAPQTPQTPQTSTQGGRHPVRNSMPAESLFGSSPGMASFENDATFELNDISQDEPVKHQIIGKVMFALLILIIGFLVFVAARNGWELTISEFPAQVSFAMSSQKTEILPTEVEHIDVTVLNETVISKDTGLVVIAKGEVINGNPSPRSKVILRGQILDDKGNVVAENRLPCGKVLEEETIKNTRDGAINGHFHTNGQIYECSMAPNGSTIFQMIVERVPDSYNAAYSLKVQAVAAVSQ